MFPTMLRHVSVSVALDEGNFLMQKKLSFRFRVIGCCILAAEDHKTRGRLFHVLYLWTSKWPLAGYCGNRPLDQIELV